MSPLPLWTALVKPTAPLVSFLPLDALRERFDYDPRLGQLWEFVAERHGEPRLRLPLAARWVGSNKDHLNCLLKEACGLTFVGLLSLYRVNRAADRFWARNFSVTEVYLDCGFGSAATFGRQFLAWTGRRPSDFKRACRGRHRMPPVRGGGEELL